MTMTDTEILDWLADNCNYLEHGDKPDGFWPQDATTEFTRDDAIGLSLREYVDVVANEDLPRIEPEDQPCLDDGWE